MRKGLHLGDGVALKGGSDGPVDMIGSCSSGGPGLRLGCKKKKLGELWSTLLNLDPPA